MRCPRCGTWLRPGVSRCGPCGSDFADSSKPATKAFEDLGDEAPPWASGWSGGRPRRRHVQTRQALITVAAMGLVATGAVGANWIDDGPDRRPLSAHEQRHAAPSDSVRIGDFSAVYETVHDGVGQVLVETCSDGDFTGTAFLVRPRVMVTAQHVVEDASRVRVELNGKMLDAEIKGVDLDLDLALLRVERRVGGHVFEFAATDPAPGTRVAAIGFPLDEPKTLTEGTISGLDREIDTESGSFDGMIQTDTAINPGNSGGPLVDQDGEVVGVADAIRRHAQGIGFAVPASTAADILAEPLDAQEPDTCS